MVIPIEDWLRGCIYHDGRHGYVTLPTDKVHQIANYIQRTRRSGADGLIDLEVVEPHIVGKHADAIIIDEPNSSEKPNNCETCKFGEDKHRYVHICNECGVGINNYEPKTEPQTWTKENCKGCKYSEYPYDSGSCFVRVCINGNKYEPKIDQTERSSE